MRKPPTPVGGGGAAAPRGGYRSRTPGARWRGCGRGSVETSIPKWAKKPGCASRYSAWRWRSQTWSCSLMLMPLSPLIRASSGSSSGSSIESEEAPRLWRCISITDASKPSRRENGREAGSVEATRRGYGTPGTRASSGGGAGPSGVVGDARASERPSGLAHLACAGLAVSPEEPDAEQNEPEVDGDDDENLRGVDIEIVDLSAR